MIFTSLHFCLFFTSYIIIYLIIPKKFNLYLIIFGSLIFYGWWNVYLLFIPLLLTSIAFFGVIFFSKFEADKNKKIGFILTIIVLFIPLIFYKYFNFFYFDVIGLTNKYENKPIVDFGIPLGISFITFSLISYVVDVFTNKYQTIYNFKLLLSYVLFFPQLIAGPILRPFQLISQLNKDHNNKIIRNVLGYKSIKIGLAIIAIGIIKKVIVADKIAVAIDPVFEHGFSGNEWMYLLGIYGFTVQIYCDFSGYTDIAIGTAKILGVRLPRNFERPYLAVSPVDFWKKWHITLSLWLRDYLYIPLGGGKLGNIRKLSNILITMILGGLWHGANWTFLFWGLIHGVAISFIHVTRPLLTFIKIPKILAIFLTIHFIAITWVFFRSPDITTAFNIIINLKNIQISMFMPFFLEYLFEITLMILFFISHPWDRIAYINKFINNISNILYVFIIAFILIASLVISEGNSGQFIYFDF